MISDPASWVPPSCRVGDAPASSRYRTASSCPDIQGPIT